MRTNTRRFATRLLAVLVSLCVACPYAFAGEVGKVTYVEGRVDVLRAKSDVGVPIREGESISAGDAIRTKSNSKAEITFNDNSVLRLAPSTKINIKDYQFDENNRRKSATISLERGKARTIIAKMPKAADFIISTPNAEGKVKGSDIFAFYQAGNSGMLVSEGRLSVINTALPQDEIIIPSGNSVLVQLNEAPKGPRPYFELEKKFHEDDTNIPLTIGRRDESAEIRGAIAKFSGDVRITTKGATSSHAATLSEVLEEGDRIETGDNGMVEIKFDNGNGISLKPGSNLLITRLVMDLKTGEYENLFESSMGKIRARIENLKGKSRFEVKTPTAVSGARGTIMFLVITATSIQAYFEGGSGFVTNLISGLEKTVAAGENAYANTNGAVSDPIPTSQGERESFGEGWDPGSGVEGYSAPEGAVGVYLATSDTGTMAITPPPTTGEAPETEGTEVFSDVPFSSTIGTTTTTTTTTPPVVIEPTTSSGSLHNDVSSYYGGYWSDVFNGLIALVGSFWGGQSAQMLSAGAFYSGDYSQFIWHGAQSSEGPLFSNDPASSSRMTYDGGAFYGVTGGIGLATSQGTGILDGFAKVIYIDPFGNAGIAGGDLAGVYSDLTSQHLLGGTLTAIRNFGNVGVAPEELYNSIYISNYGDGHLYGAFPEAYLDGYDIFNTISIVDYENHEAQNWGIYTQRFYSGYYSGPIPGEWTAMMGGNDYFGYERGYWLADIINGTWGGNILTANLNGRFITYTTLGTLSGSIIGTYNDEVAWQAVGVGEWIGVPLTLSGEWGDYYYDGYYEIGDWSLFNISDGEMYDVGEDFGIIGATDANWWDAEFFQYFAAGSYYISDGYEPFLWSSPIFSYNSREEDYSTIDGGAFFGVSAGIWDRGTMNGAIRAIYVAPTEEEAIYSAGLLRGNVTGAYYPGIDMWEAEGTLQPTKMADGLEIEPAYFLDDYIDQGYLSGGISGNFGYDSPNSNFAGYTTNGNTTFISGQEWGIYNFNIGQGTAFYNPDNSKIWLGVIEGDGQFGYSAISGVMSGDVYGTYDEESNIWMATSIGTWHRDSYIDEVEYEDGSYYGFIGGVWDGEIIIGKMIALFAQPFIGSVSRLIEFGGSGVSGFAETGNMAVEEGSVRGADTGLGIDWEGQPQGVWGLELKGTASPSILTSPFLFTIGGGSEEGYWIGVAGGVRKPETNLLKGAYHGILLDLSYEEGDDFDGNIYNGELLGILGNGTDVIPWQMVGLGEWSAQYWDGEWIEPPASFDEFLDPALLIKDPISGSGIGDFDGTGGIGRFDISGDGIQLDEQDWGIYYMSLSGNYNNPEGRTVWSSVMGGNDSDDGGKSYWYVYTNGIWQDGGIWASTEGHAISDSSIAWITGDAYGLYNETGENSGTWALASVGHWADRPGTFGANLLANFGWVDAVTENDVIFDDTTSIDALFGTVATLWPPEGVDTDSEKHIFIAGEYSGMGDYKLWGGDFSNTVDGASFIGTMGGTVLGNFLRGLMIALYIRPDGEDGWRVGYMSSSDIDGDFYPELGMLIAQGDMTIGIDRPTSITPIELFAEDSPYFVSDLSSSQIGGDISGVAKTDSLRVFDQYWGIWRTASGGTYEGLPSGDWRAVLGGKYEDEGTGMVGRYWYGNIMGTRWSEGFLSATIFGTSLDFEGIGYFYGNILGDYGDGAWEALALGSTTIEALTAGGWLDNTVLAQSEILGGAALKGFLGVTGSIWGDGSTSNFLSIGDINGPFEGDLPFIWHSAEGPFFLYSYNPDEDNYTTYDGGAFYGLSGGLGWNGKLKGLALALYIDPFGNAGILRSELDGEYSQDIGLYRTQGKLVNEMKVAEIGISPEDLVGTVEDIMSGTSNIETAYFEEVFGGGDFAGTGSVTVVKGGGLGLNIRGQDWGIWGFGVTGAYSNPGSQEWNVALAGNILDWDTETYQGSWIGKNTGEWAEGAITGAFKGVWITSNGDEPGISAGVLSGETIGNYIEVGETSGTWQAVSAGEWVEVTDLLETANLGFDMTELQDFVSVPITEVYSNVLNPMIGTNSFVNTAEMAVTLYQNINDMRIWSGLINGSYSGGPANPADWSLAVNNDAGDSATLRGTRWDSGNWVADVSGTVGGADISGQAGGTYTGTDAGTFTGVGAGTWSPAE